MSANEVMKKTKRSTKRSTKKNEPTIEDQYQKMDPQ